MVLFIKIISTMNKSFTWRRFKNYSLLSFIIILLGSLQVNAQLSVSVSGDDPSCNGFTNGTLSATANGGVPPYNYAWSSGQTGPAVFGVGAGTYTVTVTDQMGSTTGSVTLNQPSALQAQANSTGTNCSNAGGVDASATGGVGSYSYTWSNGATTKTQSGLSSGLYCVTVTDANGCEAASCTGVTGPLMVDVTTFDSRCAFACDGSANAIVSGGTGPYTYIWNTGGTTPTISPLPPGTYTVTVTDANGCMTTGTGIVSEPPPVILDINTRNPSCANGNGGEISVSSTGGVGPYSYLWNTGQTTGTISNLSAGTYVLNVTDANGCVKDSTIVLTGGSINLIVNSSDVTCGGSNDGSATAFASGGRDPYTYAWSNGSNGTFIGNLAPGTYTVTATDADGCSATNSVTVADGGSGLNLNFTSNDESCTGSNDGSASVSATGGSGNYTYSWSNGMRTGSIGNLAPGSYSVTVDDGTGCSSTGSVVVNAGNAISVSTTSVDIPCGGGALGSATANPTGTAPFSYAWSNGGNTQTVSNLAAGNYSVTVTDANGCTATSSVTVTEDSGITVNVTSTDVMCLGDNNGSATAIAAGGSGVTYSWSNGATGATINGLGAGTYTVTATDSNGCTATGSTTITAPTSSVSGSASITSPISVAGANDGQATANGSGGMPGYTYSWSNGATTQSISNLGPGTYTVTITDSKGCTTTASVTLVEGAEPCFQDTDPGTVSTDQTFCGPGVTPNQLVGTAPTGGQGPIRYLWMYSTGSKDFGAGTYSAIQGATGMSYSPGAIYETTHFVRCSWRGGCPTPIETDPVTITIEDSSLATIEGGPTYCPGEAITFSTPAMTGATYSWEFDILGGTGTPTTSSSRTGTTTYTGNNPRPIIRLTVSTPDCPFASQELKLSIDPDCSPMIILRTSVNNNNAVMLDWSAMLNDDNYLFEVQRSNDGLDFITIAELNATGDGAEMGYFSFMDNAPKKGHSHYQIKLIRLSDGQTAASTIEDVMVAWGSDNVLLYPNPTNGQFNIERYQTFNSAGNIDILNSRGQVVRVFRMEKDLIRKSIDLGDLPSGVYMIRVSYNKAVEPEIHKFIKR